MPTYDVQICRTINQYYRIQVNAPNEDLATSHAEDIWRKTGMLEFSYEEGEDETMNAEVVSCTELRE